MILNSEIKKIESIEQYDGIVGSYNARGTYTNNFLSKQTIVMEIESNSLFYRCSESEMLILRSREEFTIVNYHLKNLDKHFDIRSIGRCVIEVINQNDNETEVVKYWNNQGFRKYLARIHMVRREKTTEWANSIKKLDTALLFAEENDADICLEMIKSIFDRYSGCIPLREMFIDDVKMCRVICVKKETRIIGLVHFGNTFSGVEIRHLVVLPEFEGHGYGTALIREAILRTKAKACFVWVGEENIRAQNTYGNSGFVQDNLKSEVMVYR